MSAINDGGPVTANFTAPHPDGGTVSTTAEGGLSIRDWFAAHVAAGYMAHTGSYGLSNGPDSIAERSYQIADAMLAERAKAERS